MCVCVCASHLWVTILHVSIFMCKPVSVHQVLPRETDYRIFRVRLIMSAIINAARRNAVTFNATVVLLMAIITGYTFPFAAQNNKKPFVSL